MVPCHQLCKNRKIREAGTEKRGALGPLAFKKRGEESTRPFEAPPSFGKRAKVVFRRGEKGDEPFSSFQGPISEIDDLQRSRASWRYVERCGWSQKAPSCLLTLPSAFLSLFMLLASMATLLSPLCATCATSLRRRESFNQRGELLGNRESRSIANHKEGPLARLAFRKEDTKRLKCRPNHGGMLREWVERCEMNSSNLSGSKHPSSPFSYLHGGLRLVFREATKGFCTSTFSILSQVQERWLGLARRALFYVFSQRTWWLAHHAKKGWNGVGQIFCLESFWLKQKDSLFLVQAKWWWPNAKVIRSIPNANIFSLTLIYSTLETMLSLGLLQTSF